MTFISVNDINFHGSLSALSIIIGTAQSPSKNKIKIINKNIIVTSGPRIKVDKVFLKNFTHHIPQIKFQLNNSNAERIRPLLKLLFLETFQYKRSLKCQTINLLCVSVLHPSKFSMSRKFCYQCSKTEGSYSVGQLCRNSTVLLPV